MVMIGYRDSGKCQHHYEGRGGAVLGKQWTQRSTSSSVSLSAAVILIHWHSVNTLLSIVQPTSGLNPAEWGEWSDWCHHCAQCLGCGLGNIKYDSADNRQET